MQSRLLSWTVGASVLILASCAVLGAGADEAGPLTLDEAVRLALAGEPGAEASRIMALARRDLSVAEGALPDPQLSLGITNVPADGLDLRQEDMTQFQVDIRQAFPKGRSRAIRSRIEELEEQMLSAESEARRLEVARDVALLWLDLRYTIETLDAVRGNRAYFADLLQVTRSLYTLGKRDQADLLYAQVEVSRLDEQIAAVAESERRSRNQLSRWIGAEASGRPLAAELTLRPDGAPGDPEGWVLRHPVIRQLDLQIESATDTVELARQDYKPGWALNLGYAHRNDSPTGRSRADLLSASVMVDVPLFPERRQDRRVRAMEYRAESLRSTRLEALRRMLAELAALQGDHESIQQRLRIYDEELLPRVEQRSHAALKAYQSDATDFADVIDAYSHRLEVWIDYRRIRNQEQKLLAQIAYYQPGSAAEGGTQP